MLIAHPPQWGLTLDLKVMLTAFPSSSQGPPTI